MKIHYLSYGAIPSRKAHTVHVLRMTEALAHNGHDLTLFVPGCAPVPTSQLALFDVEDCFRVVACEKSDGMAVGGALFALRVFRAAREIGLPDLFYGRHVLSLLAVSATGIPLVYEAHAPPQGSLYYALERWLFSRPNFRRLVVISDALRRQYVDRFPMIASKIVVAHDAARAIPEATLSSAVQKHPDRLNVGYTGHLYAGRGIEVIVELSRRCPEFNFHVVGGDDADLQRWRAEADLPNLHWHGYVPHAKVPDFLAGFDILLAPYQNRVMVSGGTGETSQWMSPLKIFEYMSHGKAVICSDLDVLREVLTDGHNALLVRPDDIEAWYTGIRRLAGDPVLRSNLGANARADFMAQYTWERRADTVLQGLIGEVGHLSGMASTS